MKTALVTGASRGIGKAIANKLLSNGYFVIFVARNFDFKKPKNSLLLKCDLLKKEEMDNLLKQIGNINIDVLIHNVGGKINGESQPLSSGILLKSMHFNLGISTDLNATLIPLMVNNGGGKIIFISSDSALNGNAAPGYVAAKAAINAYMKSCARHYAKQNMVIFSVLPGIVYAENAKYEKEISINRDFSTPNDVADIIYSLLQSESKFINGGEFVINGGK